MVHCVHTSVWKTWFSTSVAAAARKEVKYWMMTGQTGSHISQLFVFEFHFHACPQNDSAISFNRPPNRYRKALSFTNELSFLSFLFYQSTALSSRVVDGHQMYSVRSVVGKASMIQRSRPPSANFHRRSKSARNLTSFPTSFNFARSKMQQDIWTLKQISSVETIAVCLRQVWWSWDRPTHPWEQFDNSAPPPKIVRRKRAKSSITAVVPWIIRFRSNSAQSSNNLNSVELTPS